MTAHVAHRLVEVERSGTRLMTYALDLQGSPADIEGSAADLAQGVARISGGAVDSATRRST
ncbi:MAG TPA: hypothetical protein VNT56_09575 [Acidimicrobiales bacterium]|nr:hypothetical protein [Acidimicrobiales bacterium]